MGATRQLDSVYFDGKVLTFKTVYVILTFRVRVLYGLPMTQWMWTVR